MRMFLIPENVANVILNYLATRPINEAADMYNAIRQLQAAPVPSPATKDLEAKAGDGGKNKAKPKLKAVDAPAAPAEAAAE